LRPIEGIEANVEAEVTISTDSPGFIANAILMPMLNEAMMVLEKVSCFPFP